MPERPLGRRIEFGDHALMIDADDRVERRLEHRRLAGLALTQLPLRPPPFADVSKYQHAADDFAFLAANWSRAIVDGALRAVFGDEYRVIRQADDNAFREGLGRRVLDRLTRLLVYDVEHDI